MRKTCLNHHHRRSSFRSIGSNIYSHSVQLCSIMLSVYRNLILLTIYFLVGCMMMYQYTNGTCAGSTIINVKKKSLIVFNTYLSTMIRAVQIAKGNQKFVKGNSRSRYERLIRQSPCFPRCSIFHDILPCQKILFITKSDVKSAFEIEMEFRLVENRRKNQ